MKIKIFLILSLFFLFINQIYSATNSYQEFTHNQPWKYEIYETTNNQYNTLTSTKNYESTNTYSNTGRIIYNIKSNAYGRYFRYPTNTEDFVFKKGGVDLKCDGIICGYILRQYTSQFTKYTSTELGSTTCQINSLTFNNNQVQITSNLKPLQTSSGTKIKYGNKDIHLNPNNPIEHLLEKYYYMKAEVKADLYDPKGDNIATFYPNEKQSNSQYSNFVLLKPNRNVFNLNLPNKNSLNLNNGNYYWNITVNPIDLKCDFNNNGILENNEIKNISKKISFSIKNNKNICQPILNGPINNEIFEVKINENQEIDSTISFKVFKKRLTGNSFYKKPVIEKEKNIKLSKTEKIINLTKDFDFDKNNLGFGEYKYEILIKTNDEYCHKNIKTAGFSSDKFKSENKIVKTISDDLIKKSFLKDKEHFGKKIGVSINGKRLYFDNRPLIFSNITSKISIKQNGISKNESVEIRDIALISHKIKKLKNFEESQQLISNIENTFKNKKIYKNISSLNSQTKVDISVPNLQDDEKILIYFDKSVISRSQAPAWERVV